MSAQPDELRLDLPMKAPQLKKHKLVSEEPPAEPEFLTKADPRFFICRPCDVQGLAWSTPEEFAEAANAYFESCAAIDSRPNLTGLVLALGLPGPTSLYRLARRAPQYRFFVTRCITAISYGYEQMLEGTKGAVYALKHLQDFDPEDTAGAPAVPFWQDKKELVIEATVPGMIDPRTQGREMTPEEAYYTLIQGKKGGPITIIEHNAAGRIEHEVNPLTEMMTVKTYSDPASKGPASKDPLSKEDISDAS